MCSPRRCLGDALGRPEPRAARPEVWSSPLGGADLRKTHVLSQIRLATPLAPRSVGVKAAGLEQYSERDAVAVLLQADRESAKAFEQERGCKSTRLQQRRQAGGPRQGARADDGGTVALCLPTPRLTQVSLLARPRPRSVLLCVPVPCLSSTAQPDLRLHSVGGRSLSDATLERTFDGCQAGSAPQQLGGAQELAAPTVVPPQCAPLPGEGVVREVWTAV